MEKECYLIGDPVIQSPSASIMNAAFSESNLPYTYKLLRIPKKEINIYATFFLRKKNVRFFNITVPHKNTFVEYLDEVDRSVINTGAVSCVINNEGRLIGYNTDLHGFSKALATHNI